MKYSWGITALSLSATAFLISSYSHKNVATKLNNNPGQILLTYRQVNPDLGKLFSIISCGGAIYSIVKCFEEDKPDEFLVPNKDYGGGELINKEISLKKDLVDNSKPKLRGEINRDNQAKGSPINAPIENRVDLDPGDIIFSEEPKIIEPEEPKIINVPGGNNTEKIEKSAEVSLFQLMFDNRKRHLFCACPTGAGKTTLMLGYIKSVFESTKGNCIVYGATNKKSAALGLEHYKDKDDGKPFWLNLSRDKPSEITQLINRLSRVKSMMVARQDKRYERETQGLDPPNWKPIIVVLDEWNELLNQAIELKKSGVTTRIDGIAMNPDDALLSLVNCIARQGREDWVSLLIFGQDAQIQNAGINSGNKKNFCYLIPFNKGSLLDLEEILSTRSGMVNSKKGEIIFNKALSLTSKNPNGFFAWSSLSSVQEYSPIPYLPDIKKLKLDEKYFNNLVFMPVKNDVKPTNVPDPIDENVNIDFWA